VAALGRPVTTAASGDAEFLIYREQDGARVLREMFVKLECGKVVQYGRIGDFNTPRQVIDLNVSKPK
jgi:hypothetical protein